MKHLIFTFLVTISTSIVALGQSFVDGFDNNDLNSPNVWSGDVSNFEESAGFLRLNDQNATITPPSILYTTVNTAGATTWEFDVFLDFNPSGSNFAKVFIMSNTPNYDDVNGYYVEVGSQSGSDDVLRLRKKVQGGSNTTLISATAGDGLINANGQASASVRVTRDDTGNWSLFAKYDTDTDYNLVGTAFDDTFAESSYFGFWCDYTSTRADKFYFDNVNIDPIIIDQTPPTLVSATNQGSNMIILEFDEPLDAVTAVITSNYVLSPSINVVNTTFNPSTPNIVFITLASDMSNLTDYTVTASATDLSSNQGSSTATFTYAVPEVALPFDILINEFMADPTDDSSPGVLPEEEYIELYNRTDKVFNLENWFISSNSTPQPLPEFVLLPNSYVIIVDDSNIELFQEYGNVIAVTSFPALSNAGDNITLEDDQNNVIHSLDYTADWYRDPAKDDGGYSLELINPNAPCEGDDNWRASDSPIGGTPGEANSVLDISTEGITPALVSVYPLSASVLELTFSQGMDFTTGSDITIYTMDNGINVSSATVNPPLFNIITITLDSPLETGIIYTLNIDSALENCNGEAIGNIASATFGLPERPEIGELIINEILFNPGTGGVDFVELYNNSNKFIDVSTLYIANLNDGGNDIEGVSSRYLLFPNEYVVFTESPSDIKSRYFVENENALITNDLPSFDDKEGNVSIFVDAPLLDNLLDGFNYRESFHFGLLDDEDGVSLERIDYTAPTDDPDNWHSAASTVGYATPTYKNSQFFSPDNEGDDTFFIPNVSFSPDEDGFEDVLIINYNGEANGQVATVKIFDGKGRMVRTLVNNQLLALNDIFQWDGLTDDKEKARIGIYVVLIELFDLEGNTEVIKKTCVLAGQF